MLGDDAVRFTTRLGKTLFFPVLGMNELRDLSPAFDRLTFAECTRRYALLARAPENPSPPSQIRSISSCKYGWPARLGKVEFWLAHRDDIGALLSTCEETLRAIDKRRGSGTTRVYQSRIWRKSRSPPSRTIKVTLSGW